MSEVDGGGTAPGRVVAVMSPKGGVGRTFVAANLATRVATRVDKGTALVDLDVQFGDAHHCFGVSASPSMVEVSAEVGRVGLSPSDLRLSDRLHHHPCGVAILPGAQSAVDAEKVTAASASVVIESLRAEFPWVILDTSAAINDLALCAFDVCSDIVHVVGTDTGSIRASREFLEIIDQLGLAGRRHHLLINRAADRLHGMQVSDVEAALSMEATAAISAHRSLAAAMNEGTVASGRASRGRLDAPLDRLIDAMEDS